MNICLLVLTEAHGGGALRPPGRVQWCKVRPRTRGLLGTGRSSSNIGSTSRLYPSPPHYTAYPPPLSTSPSVSPGNFPSHSALNTEDELCLVFHLTLRLNGDFPVSFRSKLNPSLNTEDSLCLVCDSKPLGRFCLSQVFVLSGQLASVRNYSCFTFSGFIFTLVQPQLS